MSKTTITNIGMSRLSNAFHASFHHTVSTQIEDIGDENLGLPAGFNRRYLNAVKTEQDIVNRTLGSEKTELMDAQDLLRNNYYRSVRNALRNAKFSSKSELKELYPMIEKKLIKPYPASYARESIQAKSSHIRGFIYDCKQFLSESQRTNLGIIADLAALETANEAFETTYLVRVEEYVSNPAGFTNECRADVDECWNQLVRTLTYYANEKENPSSDVQTIAINVEAYVANLNEHITEFKRSVKASKRNRKKNDNGDAGNTDNGGGSGNAGESGTSGSGNGGSGNGGGTSGGGTDSGNGGSDGGGSGNGGSTGNTPEEFKPSTDKEYDKTPTGGGTSGGNNTGWNGDL